MTNITTYLINAKTDLLGAFTEYILFSRFYADYHSKKLCISKESNLDNLYQFEKQPDISKYELVSTDTKEDHIKYRKTIVSGLIKCDKYIDNESKTINGCLKLEKDILKIGLHKIINDKSILNIRNDILKILPHTNIDTKKLIAIHFRAGEVYSINNRYIHSEKYKDLIKKFKKEYPNHKIIIFTGTLPPKNHDDLSTFEGLEIKSCSPDPLETWRIFIEADIFVMARSSFSHSPALVRLSSQKTFYAKFWHFKLKHWNTWISP